MNAYHTIVLTLIFVSTSDAGYMCVPRCFCAAIKGMIVANCAHSKLTTIPQPSDSLEVHVLHLSDNLIENLPGDKLERYKHLRLLNLTGNSLARVDGKALSVLTSLRKLDLSRNKLQMIMETDINTLKHNLTWLSVAQNFLRELPGGLSDFQNLKYLDISGNSLIKTIQTDQLPVHLREINIGDTGVSRLTKNSFRAQLGLAVVHLKNMPFLEYVDISNHPNLFIRHDTFHTAPNLTSLNLRNCGLTQTPSLVNHQAMVEGSTRPNASDEYQDHLQLPHWYNPKLELLDLSDNSGLIILPHEMIFPPSLLHLKLGHIEMPIIHRDFLEYASRVKTLDLGFSNVGSIEADTFLHLKELEEVVLSGNPLNKVPVFPSSIKKMRISHIKLANLTSASLGYLNETTELDLSDNGISVIEDDYFKRAINLRHLNLSGSSISVIRPRMLQINSSTRQSALISLDISRGILRRIEGNCFTSHSQLEDLSLNGNVIQMIGEDTLDGLLNLKRLFLQRNDITDISPGAFSKTPKLQILHLEHNRLEVLLRETLSGLSSVTELYLQFNKLHTVHPSPLASLVSVNISNNRLQYIPILGGKNLTRYDGSLNFIKSLKGGYFRMQSNLKFLNLSSNAMHDMNFTALFSHLAYLRSLDLRNNRIVSFPNAKLPSLEDLYIGNNRIRELSSQYNGSMDKMRHIHLSRTNLTYIDPKFFDGFPLLEDFDLSGSFLSCTCDFKAFIKWCQSHENIVKGLDSVRCYWPLNSLENSAVHSIQELACGKPATVSASAGYDASAMYIGVALTAAIVLILIIFLIRVRYKTPPLEVGEYEMQSDNEIRPTTRVNSGERGLLTRWMSCCLRRSSSVYSPSRVRFASDEEGDLVMTSVSDKSSPAKA